MGFKFASFGAATVPLSKIVIDRALDMGDYPLIGQKIMAPYRPYTWETEPFPYDDRSPTTLMTGISKNFYNTEVLVLTWTCDTPRPCYVRAIIPTGSSGCTSVTDARIVINGETVYNTGSWAAGTTKTTDAIAIAPGEVFELYASNTGGTYGACIQNCSLVNTGHQAPINLDLQGRFLALEQDFGDLTATLTFGNEANVPFTIGPHLVLDCGCSLTFGDETDVPFSDYPNRFPYAPDKITFNRHALENRPVIKVYKGV